MGGPKATKTTQFAVTIPRFLRRSFLSLSLVLGVSFVIHTQMRLGNDLNPLGDMLVRSYLLNLLLAFGILVFIYSLRNRLKTQLGFLFIAGSLLKFLLFFLLFYPGFTADGGIGQSEFSSFFVPYFLALLIETGLAAGLLKKLEKENPG